MGNYIHNYVDQEAFEFDKSMYVNFSTGEITYYGINKIIIINTEQEYMDKLEGFVGRRVEVVKQLNNQTMLYRSFDEAAK